jgi:hypothetical protein
MPNFCNKSNTLTDFRSNGINVMLPGEIFISQNTEIFNIGFIFKVHTLVLFTKYANVCLIIKYFFYKNEKS